MFLKNSSKASKSIRARSAITASCAVTIGAACVWTPKITNAQNPPTNKHLTSPAFQRYSYLKIDADPSNAECLISVGWITRKKYRRPMGLEPPISRMEDN